MPLALLAVVLLTAPILSLLWRTLQSARWGSVLADPVVSQALALSLETTAAALVVVVLLGAPTAYVLARRRFRGREALDTLLSVPMVLPPVVAGLALLMAFGRKGTLGQHLAAAGLELAFTPAGVVLAQVFVALPVFIRSARVGFEGVDPQLELVAATLGASPAAVLRRVTLPLAGPALVSGAVLAWTRALAEFGATLMFAGNYPGRTQTMPLAIYSALETDLDGALALAVVLLGVSFAALLVVRRVGRA